jgi:tRNA dimethylallyltransferase
MAAIEIARLHGHGMTPILVGGTGFYLQALLSPLAPIPEIPDHVRQSVLGRCKAKGPQLLHLELEKTDPEAAARIHPNDTQRVTRALEVYEATGETLSAWQAKPVEGAPEYDVLTFGVGLDIRELEPKLDARIGEMLGAGALDEIRAAWERCPDRDAPGWSGIGCAELLAHHLGEMTLDEARDLWFRNTRAYAKRQMTWFKRDKAIRWFRPGEADAMAREAVRFMG